MVAEEAERMLRESAVGFRDLWLARMTEAVRSPGMEFYDAPPRDERASVNGCCAAYLLGELRRYESLPTMLAVYRGQEPLPVPRVLLFSVMHELAMSHPEEGLSAEALQALHDYRAVAADLPRAERISVPAWNADKNESDFRSMLLRQEIGLRNEPTVSLTAYPRSMSKFENIGGRSKPELEKYVHSIQRFIRAAYGTANKASSSAR
jgi:hypothetical protein